jgi:SAM-dependent methyltransferase
LQKSIKDIIDIYRFRRRNGHIPPIPPLSLRYNVAGSEDIKWFHESGAASVKNINDALLQATGRDATTFEHIFDFGCGCARILRWFENYPPTCHFYGTDIDEKAIHWSKKNISFANFQVNGPLPPLPFEKDKFDLVYANSVFTHINEDYQDQWLTELKRVSVNGAILVLTVHGEHIWQQTYEANPTDPVIKSCQEQLETKGILFVSNDFWKGRFPDFYQTTYHKQAYIMEHWGKYFEVLSYIKKGILDFQDAVVVRNNKV